MKRKAVCVLITVLAVFIGSVISSNVYADEYIHGYFIYTIEDESVTITDYTGSESVVTVPAMIGGNPVNTIASGAFSDSESVVTVRLPDTVTSIQAGAFRDGQDVAYYSSSSGDSAGEETAQEDWNTGGSTSPQAAGSETENPPETGYNAKDGQYEETDVGLSDDDEAGTTAADQQRSGSSLNPAAQSESAGTEKPAGTAETDGAVQQSEDKPTSADMSRAAVPVIIIIAAAVCACVLVIRRKNVGR